MGPTAETGMRASIRLPSPRPHVLGRLLGYEGGATLTKGPRRLVLWFLALAGLLTLGRQVRHLLPPALYHKDFAQEYILARAALDGAMPYAPLPSLAGTNIPQAASSIFPHPTPHPPFLAVLSAPFGLIAYEAATAVWLALELAFLVLLVIWLLRMESNRIPAHLALLVACVLLLWQPVAAELASGQVKLLVATLLVGCWTAFRSGQPRLAGVALGLSTAITLFPGLIVGYFALRRAWRVVGWATGSLLASCALSLIALGPEAIRMYALEAIPRTSEYWRAADGNCSVHGLAWRSLAGNVYLSPLVDQPWLAGPLSALASLIVVAIAALVVRRAADPDVEYSVAVCSAVLVSPIAWQHAFVLLVLPIWVLVKRIRARGWVPRETNALLIVLVLLSSSPGLYGYIGIAAAGALGYDTSVRPLPGIAGVPLAGLTLGLVVLFAMLVWELRQPCSRTEFTTAQAERAPATLS